MNSLLELGMQVVDFFLHLDAHLAEIIQAYGLRAYMILFLIVFCETGLVVTPILPGDSLRFAAGTFSALEGGLNLWMTMIVLAAAAILGDTVNYWIGRILGSRLFCRYNVRFLNRKHLDRTHRFFEKYGGETIIVVSMLPAACEYLRHRLEASGAVKAGIVGEGHTD